MLIITPTDPAAAQPTPAPPQSPTHLMQQRGVGLRDSVQQLTVLGQADGKGLEQAVHPRICVGWAGGARGGGGRVAGREGENTKGVGEPGKDSTPVQCSSQVLLPPTPTSEQLAVRVHQADVDAARRRQALRHGALRGGGAAQCSAGLQSKHNNIKVSERTRRPGLCTAAMLAAKQVHTA